MISISTLKIESKMSGNNYFSYSFILSHVFFLLVCDEKEPEFPERGQSPVNVMSFLTIVHMASSIKSLSTFIFNLIAVCISHI